MIFTRSIGKFLRGKSGPFQVYSAAILAGMISFTPGFEHTPFLDGLLLVLLFLLNANLFLAVLLIAAGVLLGLLAQSLSFWVGRILIDGPLAFLFEFLINAPVTAWLHFDNYVAVGGLLLGTLAGLLVGGFIMREIRHFRRKMASLEEGSERYQAYTAKRWVRLLAFLFFGGLKAKGKQGWAGLSAQKKFGNPIRPLGAVIAAILVALLVTAFLVLEEAMLTSTTRSALERANGATVDLEAAEVDLAAGRLTFRGLAMADPNALDTDLLRATTLEADWSNFDILRKKVALDRVELSGAAFGLARENPGERVGDPPEIEEKPEEVAGRDIGAIIENGRVWKERLTQARRWLDRLRSVKPENIPGVQVEEARRRLEERLKRRADRYGYASVTAGHRITDKPTFTIYELVANGVTVSRLPGEVLDIRGENLSSQPALVAALPHLVVASESGRLGLDLRLGLSALSEEDGYLKFHYNGLPVESISRAAGGENFPFQGGSFDLSADGPFVPEAMNLPLRVVPRGSTLKLPGLGSRPAPEQPLTLLVTGPLDAPGIQFEGGALADVARSALVEEGKSQLRKQLGDSGSGLLDALGGLGSQSGEGAKEEGSGAADDSSGKDSSDKDSNNAVREAGRSLLEGSGLFGGGRKKEEAGSGSGEGDESGGQ